MYNNILNPPNLKLRIGKIEYVRDLDKSLYGSVENNFYKGWGRL